MGNIGMCLVHSDGTILGQERYVVIDGVTYDLAARVAESGKDPGKVKLSDVPAGEIFKLGDHEMIVLEQSGDTTAVILKGLLATDEKFDKNNHYEGSNVDHLCMGFGGGLCRLIGKENVIEHTVDLTADDGLKDYGKIRRKASLLTADQYRRYVYLLDKYNPDKWWWLATPWSTPAHGGDEFVKCVSPSGYINFNFCYFLFGVRPFCILNSSIFVSQ